MNVALLIAAVALQTPQPAEWKLSTQPHVSIGGEGDPHTEFQRIGGVTRAPTGEIVVVNSGSYELRVFDAAGKYLRSLGRRGAGPGEFQSVYWIGRSADSLFLYDFSGRRITIYSVAGKHLGDRVAPSSNARLNPMPVGRLRGGGYPILPIPPTTMQHPDGTFRDSITVGVLPATLTDTAMWIGTFPYNTHIVINPGNAERAQTVGTYAFAPGFRYAVTGDVIWIGDTGSNELKVLDRAGKVLLRPRVPWTPRAFDQAELAAARKRMLEAISEESQRAPVAARYDSKYLPKTEPLFANLLPGDDGAVWVERFRLDNEKPGEYLVLDARGQPRAHVTIPTGFSIREIGADYVLGIASDADGVQSVRLYGLQK